MKLTPTMKKALFAGILFFAWLPSSYSQADTSAHKSKGYDQFIGVQANNLIREVFSFTNNPSLNNNPYLLNYSINSRRTGWGLRLGVGYAYNSNTTDDGVTKTVTNINDYELRLGVEKAFRLSRKWSTGVGIDLLLNNNNDNTTTVIRDFDTVTSTTKSKVTSYGGGAMAWLRYSISKNVILGTEASVYYTTGKTSSAITTSTVSPDPFQSPITTSSTASFNSSQEVMSGPVTLFLIVRF